MKRLIVGALLCLFFALSAHAQTESFWTTASAPANTTGNDSSSVELGLRFSSNVAGNVTGARVFCSQNSSGTHTVHLWSSNGTSLTTATLPACTGWTAVNFASPVAVTAGSTYTISYHTTEYPWNTEFFTSAVTSGNLTAPSNAGVYAYGSSPTYPSSAWEASNYWVDVLFTPTTATPTYTISGTMSGVGRATVLLSGASSASTVASRTGTYSFAGLAVGSYTVTPTLAGYTFSPTSQTVGVSSGNVTVPAFTATAVQSPSTFTISGTISGTGGSGATVSLSGAAAATTTANGSGAYSFARLANGKYAVTPSQSGFNFSPTVQSVTVNGGNATVPAFTATAAAPTYTISGTITPTAIGSGAIVNLTGAATATTTANSSGYYAFAGLANGAYAVTPTSSTATFTPTSQSVMLSGTNASVAFTATATSNVIFFDDFLGSTLNSTWTALDRHGDYSNNDLECYLSANVTLSAGFLDITSMVQTETCGDADHTTGSWNYTSGMVQWSSFNFTYGTLEFRAQMPGGQGTWPAIWLLGSNCQASNVLSADNIGSCVWPQVGSDEIDITEILNSNYTSVNQQIHTGGPANGPAQHNDGCTASTADTSSNYHVYDVVWSAGSVIWKIDGTTTCTINKSYVPSTPMFLIINTAVGGVSAGSVNNSTLPRTMYVDYVKVTQP